eukprot:comp6392_c0_seq1/m.2190 comp6392_c0_seq1/g.2190  ORF comp6392_c0_seq1/g.2190 comp6392_c0_seq1/m.2190 type:complete len:256 (-) comp6392_c0_seq1:87-854(-)
MHIRTIVATVLLAGLCVLCWAELTEQSLAMAWRCSGGSNSELVAHLKKAGLISSDRVKSAMLGVDRGHYSADHTEAYNDNPHSIGYGATISAPHMHAMCLEVLEPRLQDGATVLDVGSGSGYLAACMALMVGPSGRVHGLEHIPQLVEWSIANAKKGNPDLLNTNLFFHVGDGFKGLPEHAPYDAIHVGAAAPVIPPVLVEQLKPGGMMVIPVGTVMQELVLVTKQASGGYTERSLTGVRYVPLTTPSHQLFGWR